MTENKTSRPVLHLISQAHLDPVWLWPLRDGVAETLTTMQSAVDRANETAQFRFTRSSAYVYRWAKEIDPLLFREIKMLVDADRWEAIGGWVEQADCNLPATESLLRQALYAKSFFSREFGEKGVSRIGYNVDSFGHAGGLPQILKASGFDYYVFMRPEAEPPDGLPLLFWWRSRDGSRVLTQRIPGGYSQSYAATADDIEAAIRHAASGGFAPGFRNGIFWLGTGNHGGGPTREHIARILELQHDKTLPEIRFSSVRDYFAAVERESALANLPVVEQELGYPFRGCYTATGEAKLQHRAAEKSLQSAEAFQIMGELEGIAKLRSDGLSESWWMHLFNEFHDILAGTCSASVQDETRSRFGMTLTTAREAVTRAAYSLARRVDTRAEKGSVLFVANPLPWNRMAPVQLDTFVRPHGREKITHLETESGRVIPLQWCRADANFGPWGLAWGKLSAAVEVPACGYSTLRVRTAATSDEAVDNVPCDEKQPFNPCPALKSLSITAEHELLAAPVNIAIIKDSGGTWGHGVEEYRDELGKAESLGTTMIEQGPVISIARERFRWNRSEIWLDVIRWAHTPWIELRVRLNWQEQRAIAKLEIPTRLNNAVSFAKMPGEVAKRPADGSEFPCQDWIALEGEVDGRQAALLLLNDATYGYDALDGLLRVPLARGVPYAEHPPFEYKDDTFVSFTDQGWQERRFWLAGNLGSWKLQHPEHLAQEQQIPAVAMLDSAHSGSAPWNASFLEITPSTVATLAIKPPENGDGIILRIQEMLGESTVMQGRLMADSFSINLQPWEIKSLRLVRTGNGVLVEEVDALENPLKHTVQS